MESVFRAVGFAGQLIFVAVILVIAGPLLAVVEIYDAAREAMGRERHSWS